VIVVAWVLGGWCIASLVGGAVWSAFRTLERRYQRTRTHAPVPAPRGRVVAAVRTRRRAPPDAGQSPRRSRPPKDLGERADPHTSDVERPVSVTNVRVRRQDTVAIASEVDVGDTPALGEP
jgi:hypothetical protein